MPDNKVTNIAQVWGNALNEIELNVSRANFTTWFKNTSLIKEEEGIVHLAVPSSFVKEWLSNKYHKFILKSLRDISENIRGVEYVIVEKNEKKELVAPDGKPSLSKELPLQDLYINKEDNLNPKYTFDSLVIGPFNELAYSAAQAVYKTPGIAYNPLFVYGKTGLGKTHLLQAIGNGIKKDSRDKKVFYITSEKFFLDYVTAVQANKIYIFKEKYRKYDVFIMDDIQFLSNKKGTQEELFHLFNILSDNNKQIIFSSDKHYNHIPNIEDRLKTRFGAGMIVDITEPDFESKVAIINKKTQSFPFKLLNEVVDYLAGNFTGSIRELEGVVTVVSCQSQIKNKPLDLADVKKIIKNNEKPKKSVSIDDVVSIVADFYGIEKEYIHQKTRRKEVVKPRQIVMYILREDFKMSFPTIGHKLGGRDHTTVIHSCEKVKNDIKNNPSLLQELDRIRTIF
ncbi:MAG: chromosomal replication initiator protein DnaA [Parcubacteria group bacterium]|nr:chromosomal replication initiator protein DnaA [Parcubacteria group bacterium]